VIVFPRVGHVWQVFIRAVEVNVVVAITVEERANIERPAQTDEKTDGVGMTKGNVGRVISAETGSANCDSMATALPPRKIEHVMDDQIFIRVMGAHAIGYVD